MLFFSFESSFSGPSQTTPSFVFESDFQVRQSQTQVFVEDCSCCDGIHNDVFGIPSLISPWTGEGPFESYLFTSATPFSRPTATEATRPIRTQSESFTYIHDPYQREDSRLRPERPRAEAQRNVRRRVEMQNLEEKDEDESQWHTHTFIGHGTTQTRTATTGSPNLNPLPNINQFTFNTTEHHSPLNPPKPVVMGNTEYYTLLGLTPSCTINDIKRAYRNLAMKYHPDKNPSLEAAEKFKAFSHANECLMDSKRRKIYDKHGPEAAGKPQEYDDEGNNLHDEESTGDGAGGGMKSGENDGVPFKFGEGIPVGLSGQRKTRWRDSGDDPAAEIRAMPEAFFKFGGGSAAAAERESQARARGQPQPRQGGFEGQVHHLGRSGYAGSMNSGQEAMEDLHGKAEELLRNEVRGRAQQQQYGMGGGYPGMGGIGGHHLGMSGLYPGMGGMDGDPQGEMEGSFTGHQHPGMAADLRGAFGGVMNGRLGFGIGEGMGGIFGGGCDFGDGSWCGGFDGPMW